MALCQTKILWNVLSMSRGKDANIAKPRHHGDMLNPSKIAIRQAPCLREVGLHLPYQHSQSICGQAVIVAEHSFAATMASLHSIPAFLSNQCAAGSILSLDSSGQVQIDHARHGILTEGRFRVSSVVMEVSLYSQVSPERDDAVDTQKKNMVSFSMCEDEATLVYSERR